MPVDDVPVHETVKHDRFTAWCHSKPRNGVLCRQIGRKTLGGSWECLPECISCTAEQDMAYIHKARNDIDREMALFMRADQRLP